MTDRWAYFYRYTALDGPISASVALSTGSGVCEMPERITTQHHLSLLKATIKDALTGGGRDIFGDHGPQYATTRIQIDALTLLASPDDQADDTEERQRRVVLAAARNAAASWAAARPAERTLIGDQLGLGVLASDLDDLVRAVGDSR